VKLISMTLEGYRQFREPTTITFPGGLIGICGPNGAGKTKIIEAISFALFGPGRGVLPKGDTLNDLPSKAGSQDTKPRVELVFRIGGQEYRVVRGLGWAEAYIGGDTTPQASSPRGVTGFVQKRLRLIPATFQGTFVARQRDVAGLQAMLPSERKLLMNQLIGVTQIERSIAFAQTEIDVRSRAADRASAGIRLSIDDAQAAINEATHLHQLAELEAAKTNEAYQAARVLKEQTVTYVVQLKEEARRVTDLEKQLNTLLEHRGGLEKQRLDVEQSLAEVARDEQLKAEAEDILSVTRGAIRELEELQSLAVIDKFLSEIEEVEARLIGPLALQEGERHEILRDIQDLDQCLQQIRGDVAGWRDTKSRADEAVLYAQGKLAQLDRQRDNALRLGPEGECETCGGILGDRLETVLQRLGTDRDNILVEITKRRSEARQVAEQLTQLLTDENQVSRSLDDLRQRSESVFAAVPGQIAEARRRLHQLQGELNSERSRLPVDLQQATYDPDRHREVKDIAEKNQEARERVAGFQHLDQRRTELEQRRRAIDRELSAGQIREQELMTEIEGCTVDSEAEKLAERKVAQCDAAEEATHHEWIEAQKRVAAAEERRKRAHDDYADAVATRRRADMAIRDQRVAESTRDILRVMLDTLTGEARPQLEQLMESWMPSLLGSRFKTVRLTDDYAIQADNGSGLHNITHFSGGEQTVLSTMLRAAISLFCRERAGFDTGFLVLDEVFGDQDAGRRNLLVQFLEEIKDHYHQIIVVNHIEEISGQLDTVIQVSLIGENESQIEIFQ
jgi:DNA repair exonuclease SbcCD ATPase subunit